MISPSITRVSLPEGLQSDWCELRPVRRDRDFTLSWPHADPPLVAWERYGKDADISHLSSVQERENYRFYVEEVAGRLAKADRINRLIPFLSAGRLWLPVDLWRTLHDNKTVDMVQVLIEEEMLPWPVPVHDDLLDAMSRIFDINLAWPKGGEQPRPRDKYAEKKERGTWMSA